MPKLTAHNFSVEVRPSTSEQIAYTVKGYVTCPTTGWVVTLEPGNEGIDPKPERAVLDLDAREPTGPEADVVTEEEVTYSGTDDARLQVIEINLGQDITTPDGDKAIVLQTVVKSAH